VTRVRVTAPVVVALALGVLASGAAFAADDAQVQGGAGVADDDGHRRVVDVELHPLFSVPDAIGLCLEGFPLRRGLSARGCASIQVFEAAALSLEVDYRFPIYTGPTLALGLGPGLGSHAIFDTPRGPLIDVSADGVASLEGVWWGDRAGFQLQLGAGAMYMAWDRPAGISARWFPIVDLTIGLAFRTHGAAKDVGTAPPASYFGR
jgi:hypothetical protein